MRVYKSGAGAKLASGQRLRLPCGMTWLMIGWRPATALRSPEELLLATSDAHLRVVLENLGGLPGIAA